MKEYEKIHNIARARNGATCKECGRDFKDRAKLLKYCKKKCKVFVHLEEINNDK